MKALLIYLIPFLIAPLVAVILLPYNLLTQTIIYFALLIIMLPLGIISFKVRQHQHSNRLDEDKTN